jgi:precorrin-3B C17-methyltransferase
MREGVSVSATIETKIKLAVNGGIDFGSKLNAKQLVTLAKYLGNDEELELTTFQQLYIEVPESRKEEAITEFEQAGLSCYPVGCGEPLINDIGIMKIQDGYNLYAGGKSKGQDAAPGILLLEQLTPDDLYEKVEKLIKIYNEYGRKREQMRKFISRFGEEELKELLSAGE